MLVDPDIGAIDHSVFEVWVVIQNPEDLFENAFQGPSSEPSEDGVPKSELVGKITPGDARAGHPKDSFDEQPIVSAASTGIAWLARQKGGDLGPLRIFQDFANQG